MTFILPFGKHRGTSIEIVPEGYLHWLMDSGVALASGFEGAVTLELQRRAALAPAEYTVTSISIGTGPIPIVPPRKTPAPPKPIPPPAPSSCWELAEKVLQSGYHVLLHGGIGLGKTTFALEVGLPASGKAYGCTLTDGMTLGDLFGRFWLRSGTSEWVDGPATRALREGARLVMNEVEAASGEIMTALHALTDHPKIAMVALPNGEILQPAPGFRVVMTSNFSPSESLPAPLVDRAICIEINCPHPASVAALPEDLRAAATASSITKDAKRRVTMRAWHHFAGLRAAIGEPMAAEAVFGLRSQDILDAFAIRRGPK